MEQASVITPVRFASVLLALLPPALFAMVGVAVWDVELGVPFGLAVYALYRLVVVRRFVCRHHRLGVALTRRGKFEDAINAFHRSEAFWARHGTLDRFRGVILGSGTSHPFHVLAQYNQAYCLSRLGRGAESLELIGRILAKHADMVPARELRDVMAAGHAARSATPNGEPGHPPNGSPGGT